MEYDFDALQRSLLENGERYCCDIVMVIDSTAGMAPLIKDVKEVGLDFCDNFRNIMEESGKNIYELRVKVITFRDYAYDGQWAMDDSGFFSLPEEKEAFYNYINSIEAKGGGDEPESALEALALAMRSDWTTKGIRRRHCIVVFTNSPAVPLNDMARIQSPYYPKDMPEDLIQLGEMWHGISNELACMPEPRFARLVVFAPDVQPWCDIQVWDNTFIAFTKPGNHWDEVDIHMAILLSTNAV